jgi:hypothetical protein
LIRKRSFPVALATLVAACAVTASVALAGPTASGPDGNTQSIETVIAPKSLLKKELAPASLKVITRTGSTTDPNGVPSPATRAVIDFDKGAAIFAKGLPTCNPALLQNVSTEIAEQKCGKAKIGSGVAHALLKAGKVYDVEQTVTAFNGVPKGGKPTVLLHTYGTTPIQTTLVLVGTVSNYDKEGYGPQLDVQIPLIAGGTGSLTEFEVTINKKFSYKGKKESFISASCPSKTLKTRSVFTYLDGSSLEALHSQPCTQKPETKKK